MKQTSKQIEDQIASLQAELLKVKEIELTAAKSAFMIECEAVLAKVDAAYKLLYAAGKEKERLLAKCPHDTIIEQSSYSSGDYGHRSFTRRWLACNICGKMTKEFPIQYGGYE